MFSEDVGVYFNAWDIEQIVYYLRAFSDKMVRKVERCVWFILLYVYNIEHIIPLEMLPF